MKEPDDERSSGPHRPRASAATHSTGMAAPSPSSSTPPGNLSAKRAAPAAGMNASGATLPAAAPVAAAIRLRHHLNRCVFTPFARANSPSDIPLSRHAASTRAAVLSFQC
jgi:hypothetical protein